MTVINTIEDFKKAICHPYRSSEYFTDHTQVFVVPEDDNEVIGLIESYDKNELFYGVLLDGCALFTEDGEVIEPVN